MTVYEINPVACVVSAASGIGSMDELAERVSAQPGELSFSTSGNGTLPHLANLMVLRAFGVDDPAGTVKHIPLRGDGAAATAVLTGDADFVCTNTSGLAAFVASGQLKPLLVTTQETVPGFDAPTANDLGKPELNKLVGWTGIAGPAGMPEEVTRIWAGWVEAATADARFREAMEARGSIIRFMDTDEANSFIRGQFETFSGIARELGLREAN